VTRHFLQDIIVYRPDPAVAFRPDPDLFPVSTLRPFLSAFRDVEADKECAYAVPVIIMIIKIV
jgi:hypothetical protein